MVLFYFVKGRTLTDIAVNLIITMTRNHAFYIGIDGGGTRCRARIADHQLNILGEAESGRANIFQDHKVAWRSFESAIEQANKDAGLSTEDLHQAHIVAGLAGAEVQSCVDQFKALNLCYSHLDILTDAQTACLGAHAIDDGAIYIIGTGSVGISWHNQQWRKIGGWGFPLNDIGSGAWLGFRALQSAIQQYDGLLETSELTEKVWTHFNHDMSQLLTWSSNATSGHYGQFAPLVTQAHERGEKIALEIVDQQIAHIEDQLNVLVKDDLPLCLMGGLSHWVADRLSEKLSQRLSNAKNDAITGALLYAHSRNPS